MTRADGYSTARTVAMAVVRASRQRVTPLALSTALALLLGLTGCGESHTPLPCTGPECAADASLMGDGGVSPPPMCVPEIPECARGEMFLCNTQSDGDGDGWWNHEDCDETRTDVHPCAVELCCDDIDSDCDGNLDPLSTACDCPTES